MRKQFTLADYINDPVETPAGIITSARSVDSLIKAEATRQRIEQNKSQFFSKYFLAQNAVAYGAREKTAGTPSFAMLYEAAEKSVIDAIIINSRVSQMKRIWQRVNGNNSKEVGFRIVHDQHDDPDFKVTKQITERCRHMEDVLGDPTPDEYTDLFPHRLRPHTRLKDLIAVLAKAELIIDRKVILRYPNRAGGGYGAFHWLPGETIKNVDESVKEWAIKNEKEGRVDRHTIEKMSYATGFDLTRASYVQMVDGMIVQAYAPDEISVHISNPSDRLNRMGYGQSRLEISLDVTTTLLYAWTYNKEMFKTNYPEAILTVSGDFDKEGLQAFKQQVLSEAGGVGKNWRLPIIPGGDVENFKIESHKLRESPKDMLFAEMIRMMLMFKAAAYGASPQTLNLSTDSGGNTSLFAQDPTSEIEFNKEQGLIPMVTDMCEWLTDAIVKPMYKDLKLIIIGLNPEDEKQAIDIRTQRASKWLTRNEARMEEGLKPIGSMDDPENMWNMPADAPLMNQQTQLGMVKQQEQEQAQGYDQEDDQQDEPVQKSKPEHPIRKYLRLNFE